MELSELQDIWSRYDKKLTENIRVNKQMLKHVLIARPRKRLIWMQLRSGIQLIASFIVIILFAFTVKLREPGLQLYSGIALMGILCGISLLWSVRYFLLLLNTDLAVPVLKIKEKLNKMKIYKMKITKIGYMLFPLSLMGIILLVKIDMTILTQNIIPFSLILMIFIMSSIYRWGMVIKDFSELNKELREIEELEK